MNTANTNYDELFGTNTLRLSALQWCFTLGVAAVILGLAPAWWVKAEAREAPRNYRVPYALSKDYGLYENHLDQSALDATTIFVVGDSVVWGEYVRRDGTLSHFLNEQDRSHNYANAGINGLFPLALEGLISSYGRAMANRKVILHCNLLWMSSPEADLSSTKEQVFNHVQLVPQFRVRLPCYKADVTARTAHVVRRQLPHLRWGRHLQVAYFEGKSVPEWTQQDDGNYPPSYPNTYANPLAQLDTTNLVEPKLDPQRGELSDRHKPWSTSGRGPQSFAWVPMEESLQWAAFQRLVQIFKSQHSDLLIVLGPFNEHMLAAANVDQYKANKSQAMEWFAKENVLTIAPATLSTAQYGDASHPLTGGYEQLAEDLQANPIMQEWLH